MVGGGQISDQEDNGGPSNNDGNPKNSMPPAIMGDSNSQGPAS